MNFYTMKRYRIETYDQTKFRKKRGGKVLSTVPLCQTWQTKNKARAKYPQEVVLYAPISQKKIHNVKNIFITNIVQLIVKLNVIYNTCI